MQSSFLFPPSIFFGLEFQSRLRQFCDGKFQFLLPIVRPIHRSSSSRDDPDDLGHIAQPECQLPIWQLAPN
jgi:hypothetical protein